MIFDISYMVGERADEAQIAPRLWVERRNLSKNRGFWGWWMDFSNCIVHEFNVLHHHRYTYIYILYTIYIYIIYTCIEIYYTTIYFTYKLYFTYTVYHTYNTYSWFVWFLLLVLRGLQQRRRHGELNVTQSCQGRQGPDVVRRSSCATEMDAKHQVPQRFWKGGNKKKHPPFFLSPFWLKGWDI